VRTKCIEKTGWSVRTNYVLEKLSNVSWPWLHEAGHYRMALESTLIVSQAHVS